MSSLSHKTAIIADDHPIILHGVESILLGLGYSVLGTFENGTQALMHILATPPDLVLLDLQMPGLSGLEIAEQMSASHLNTHIIIYTMFRDYSLYQRAMDLGVQGYLLKEFATEELRDCVRALENGESWSSPILEESLSVLKVSFEPELFCQLSVIERSIVKAISQKKTTKEIASEYFISPKTVETHRRHIISKLNLPQTRNSLLIWAIENRDFFSMIED